MSLSCLKARLLYKCILLVLGNLLWAAARPAPVLLLSLDGFRWDYPEIYGAPHLTELSRSGVRMTRGLKPTFATVTFPTHHSIATGLYEEDHGMVANKMYDPVLKTSFVKTSNDSRWWNGGGEPLWVWARRQGLKTGVHAWPGCPFQFNDLKANVIEEYNPEVPYDLRAATAMKWLTELNLDLVMMYAREPDFTGHFVGPGGPELAPSVEKADNFVGYLMNGLNEHNLLDSVNFIVTSDHGMAALVPGPDQLIVLSDYIDLQNDVLKVRISGPIAHILPAPGKMEILLSSLVKAHPKMKAYKKEDLPERYHYSKHQRILPLLTIAEEGYIMSETRDKMLLKGQHGYDNELPDMRPIFYARGPDFKVNYTSAAEMHSLDIFPLVCHLLGIPAAPNNGSLERALPLLRTG